jgi:methionyl aminopeptidase
LYKPVPDHIIRPDYARPENNGKPRKPVDLKGRPLALKNELKGEALGRMRRACAAAREVLEEVLSAVRPGVTTDELDEIAHEGCIKRGGYPSPLGYHGFPKSLCTSLNEVICHGIPSAERVLIDGDIINCDVTIYLEGMHGDCSETVFVGRPSAEARALVEFTYEAMMAGIAVAQPNALLNEIGRVISTRARKAGYSVVQDFSGHGIGPQFHMPPQVVHYYERYNYQRLKEGMVFTVEPMINAGELYARVLEDDWTAVTSDGRLSAQFEHTIYIGKRGPELLTAGEPFFKRQLAALDAASGVRAGASVLSDAQAQGGL